MTPTSIPLGEKRERGRWIAGIIMAYAKWLNKLADKPFNPDRGKSLQQML